MREQRLSSLLSVWQEQQLQGRDVEALELCRDCPELAEELGKRIEALRQMEALLLGGGSDVPTAAPADADVAATLGPAAATSAGLDPYLTVANSTAPAPISQSARHGWPVFAGYEILKELGRGGMGVVYCAHDRKRDRVVALKTLQGLNPTSLYRFKREFRALANVTHPNLVPLYELSAEGSEWFFTMEQVEGSDLLTHVRHGVGGARTATTGQCQPLSTPAQWQRLRTVLVQLAEGIQALHAAGRLHRDIKPSNVLVTPQGRAVLLDFGLVAELNGEAVYQSSEQHVLGTVVYMSPEQAAAQPVSTATDWYSVGVILYEALTGQPPFTGGPLQVLQDKVERDAPSPRELAGPVPEDLNALCLDLLRRQPEARPTGPEVVRRLTGTASPPVSSVAPVAQARAMLLGRESQLQALEDAFQALLGGQTVVVHVAGRSGMGKTALVQTFLERLEETEGTVILAGQCYEKETVPYKAFDSLVDALSQHLGRLSHLEVQAVLPRDVAALARVFPVLRGVTGSPAAPRGAEIPDVQEVRRRAFAALRELLARLGDRRALVLAIDDLQWGDLDSLALYVELLRPPDPPRLLFLGSFRSEEVETTPFLQALLASQELSGGLLDYRRLAVEPLSAAEVIELARRLLGQEGLNQPNLAGAVARESGGNPFFVYELVQHARAAAEQGQQPAVVAAISLPSVLWARIQRLPDETRRLLEVLAVAGRPLSQADASRAAGCSADERAGVANLRATRLVRTVRTADGEEITTYHDRVRETVVSQLAPERARECHHHLARVLGASGRAAPEALAYHFQGAQEFDQAAAHFVRAGDKAVAALAFDRAARFYQASLELCPVQEGQHALRVRLGEALANARRGAEAAPVFLEAAAEATATAALELRRRAAEQLLWSGRIDEGLDVIRGLLASMGMRLPSTHFRALLSVVYHRFRIWLRGLKFRERAASDIAPEVLVRIDTCWSIGLGLGCVDPFRGLVFQTRFLLLALDAGEPSRVVRALAMEVAHSSCGGGRSQKRTAQLFRTVLALAERLRDPPALALTLLCGGHGAYFEGRWREAHELFERSIQILREQCTGVTWELNEGNFNVIRSLDLLGELKELSRRLPVLLQDAESRGDHYAATNLRIRLSYLVALMNDQPERAEQETREAMRHWSQRDFHLQHYFELTTYTDIYHYRGDSAAAWKLLRERWPLLKRSLLHRVQISRITLAYLRARSALALAADSGQAAQRNELLRVAQREAQAIEREHMPWSNPQALLVRAGSAVIQGRTAEGEALLQQAELGFRAADMQLYAAVARWRRSQLLGGEPGRQLHEQVLAWMTDQGLRNPARWAAMYAPGFPD